nr:hypothetical protein [bacterium]
KVTVAGEKASVEYFDLDEGCAPTAVLGVGANLYVACSGFDWDTMAYADGQVLVVSPTTGAITGRIALPQVNPNGLAVAASADCSDLFVVCSGNYSDQTGKIVKICTHENVVKSSFDLGVAPVPIGINAEGIAFVGEGMGGSVYVFDTADNSIIHGDDDPLTIPDALWIQGLGVHPETGDAYVCDQGNGKVYVLAGDDYSEVFNVALPNPGGVAFW